MSSSRLFSPLRLSGDTVKPDDINRIQDRIKARDAEIQAFMESPDGETSSLQAQIDAAEAHIDAVEAQANAIAAEVDALQIDSLLPERYTSARYYCLDYDGGNDANVGYVDAALGAAINGSAVAVKTVRRIRDVITSSGDGKIGVLLIKPRAGGATYPDQSYAEGLDLAGIYGWRDFLVRGSDLTNSATDKIVCGAIQAQTGPDAGGSWTCAVGSTDFDINVSSGTLSTTDGITGIRFARIRFLGNVTSSLANVCRAIYSNTVSTIALNEKLPVSPAIGDRFVIEIPGVRFSTYKPCDVVANEYNITVYTVGIATTSNDPYDWIYVQFGSGTGARQIAFCEARGSGIGTVSLSADKLAVRGHYWDETQATRYDVGYGIRCNSTCYTLYGNVTFATIEDSAFFSASQSIFSAVSMSIGKSSYFKRMPRLFGLSRAEGRADYGHSLVSVFGSNDLTTISHRRTFVETAQDSSIQCDNICIRYVDLNGLSATGMRFRSRGGAIRLDDVTSSLGTNTAPVLSMLAAWNCNVYIGENAPCTITSTGGRILTREGLVRDWANLAGTTWTDAGGNFYTVGDGTLDVYRKLTPNTWGNLPISNGGDPAGVVDGDVWLRVIAGVPQICVRVGGVTKASAALT